MTHCTKDMPPRMYFDRHCTMGDDDGGQTGFPPPKSIRARGHVHHRAWNGEEDGEESFSTGSLSVFLFLKEDTSGRSSD